MDIAAILQLVENWFGWLSLITLAITGAFSYIAYQLITNSDDNSDVQEVES